MGLGFLLPGNDETYLLMGIPLTVAFQIVVRRRPLRELWVRDATSFTLGRRGLLLTALLVLAPANYGVRAFAEGDWSLFGRILEEQAANSAVEVPDESIRREELDIHQVAVAGIRMR